MDIMFVYSLLIGFVSKLILFAIQNLLYVRNKAKGKNLFFESCLNIAC